MADVTDVLSKDHISFSQFNMFLRCQMQYYWRYVQGRKERPKLDLIRGKSGHGTLEKNALHKISTQSEDNPLGIDLSTEEILDIFSTDFDKQVEEMEKEDLDPGEDPGRDKDATVEVLRSFRGSIAPSIKPLAVELPFRTEIPTTADHEEPLKPVEGKIDQIVEMPRQVTPRGRPVVRSATIDYKFPGRLPSNMQAQANMSTQLAIYDISILSATGKTPEDAGYIHMVPPTKTIAPRILPVYRDHLLMLPRKRELWHARAIYKLRQFTRAVKYHIFIPTDDPRVCNGCGFREICQDSLVKKDYDALLIRGRNT